MTATMSGGPGLETFQRNITAGLADMNERLMRVEALLEDLGSRERPALSETQRRELGVRWPLLVCRSCGTLHPGICPRVREVTYHPNGKVAVERYWPNGEWRPPLDAVRAADVFPSGVAAPEPMPTSGPPA